MNFDGHVRGQPHRGVEVALGDTHQIADADNRQPAVGHLYLGPQDVRLDSHARLFSFLGQAQVVLGPRQILPGDAEGIFGR